MYTKDLSGFDISLMNEISFYWLGFLLADGHFRIKPKNTVELSVELSDRDLDHMQKLLLFLGRSIDTYTSRTRITTLCNHQQTHVSFRLSSNKELFDLVTTFDIHSNKTEYPPKIENYNSLSLNYKYSLLIGYIDGDGYVRGRKGCRDGKLECHISWKDFYSFFSTILTSGKLVETIRPDKQNKASITLYLSSKDIKQLYLFAIDNKLPILYRKWESVKKSLSFGEKDM